jgi:hypothetical protein
MKKILILSQTGLRCWLPELWRKAFRC